MRVDRAIIPRGAIAEVARLFVKLGVIGFGGPAAHIAMMRDEVVQRRQWIDDGEFLDMVAVTNLIPGPNSTELAITLGHRRAGARGLLVAGCCFIGPAVLIVGVLAWLYARYGTEPAVADLRYGIVPVIIAIVAHAVVGLTRSAIRTISRGVIAAGALGLYLAGVHELVVLLGGGVVALAWVYRRRLTSVPVVLSITGVPIVGVTRTPVSMPRLFLVFLEIGSVLYGSGYVLIAFLQHNLVDRRGWLTSEQLLDAIAVGQVTPGPVFSTATFVGWQVDGAAGAALATVGIFLPSFVFVALLGRIVPWVRSRPAARAALDGVVAASLGLMVGVLVELTDTAIVDLVTLALAAVALAVLLVRPVNSAWLVAAGVSVGVVHALVS